MAKNFIIFRGVTTKTIKNFITDENLFVCTLIYFNKNINFLWITKNVRIIK